MLTFFWSIDRAIVLNLIVLFIILFLLLNKSFKNIIILTLSIFFFWVIFYFLLQEEFLFFISNTIGILNEMPKINGLKHPIPFSDGENASRSTKTILLILISLLISISFFFNNKNDMPYRLKISLTMISFVSFLSYIYALGRTDYTHLRQVFGFPIVFISCYLFFYIFHKIERKLLFKNYDTKKIFFTLIPLVFLFFMIFNVNFKNIINFKSRFSEYIK